MSQTDMLRTVEEVMAALDDERPVERLTKGGAWRPVPISTSKSVIIYLLSVGYQFRIASPSRQAAPADGLSEPPQDDFARLRSLFERYASKCGECDGRGYIVSYVDPYGCGDASSPEHTPCAACAGIRAALASNPSPSEPQGSQVVSDDDVRAACNAYDSNVSSPEAYCDFSAMRAAASALLARRPCAQGQGEPVAWQWRAQHGSPEWGEWSEPSTDWDRMEKLRAAGCNYGITAKEFRTLGVIHPTPTRPNTETCESAQPECGPVTNHDSQGVPLCAVCWDGLLADSAKGGGA